MNVLNRSFFVFSLSLLATMSGGVALSTDSERLYRFSCRGKDGYMNGSGKVVLEPAYSRSGEFSDGLAKVYDNEERKWGFIDRSGKYVITGISMEPSDFAEGRARILRPNESGRYVSGFIDKTGKVVIEPQYENHYASFSEGLSNVMLRGKYGYIDKAGTMVIKPRFVSTTPFSCGVACVRRDKEFFFIDKQGNKIDFGLPPYQWAKQIRRSSIRLPRSPFKEDYAPVGLDGGTAYVDVRGNIVIPPKRGQFYSFSDGLARFQEDGRWGYIDREGTEVIRLEKDIVRAGDFSSGLAVVSMIDTNRFTQIIETIGYDTVEKTWTEVRTISGYIDKTGAVVIPFQFAGARDFNGDFAAVSLRVKSNYFPRYWCNEGGYRIDRDGTFILRRGSSGTCSICSKCTQSSDQVPNSSSP